MAEMAAAAMAGNLGPHHTKRIIVGLIDAMGQRRPKAWPTGAAVELGRRGIEMIVACDAGEDAGAMLVEKRAGEWQFGALLAQHLILLRCQKLVPFRVGMHDFIGSSSFGGIAAGELTEAEGGKPGRAGHGKTSTGQHRDFLLAALAMSAAFGYRYEPLEGKVTPLTRFTDC
jgi:hypothetical protein